MTDQQKIQDLEIRVKALEDMVAGLRRAVQDAAQVGIIASTGALAETPEHRLDSVKLLTEKLLTMHEHLGTRKPWKEAEDV